MQYRNVLILAGKTVKNMVDAVSESLTCKNCSSSIVKHYLYLYNGFCDTCFFRRNGGDVAKMTSTLVSASRQAEIQVAVLILQTVQHLQTGKEKLASFLRGSHSKLVTEGRLDQQQGYGALLWDDIPTIKDYIDQLMRMNLLRQRFVRTPFYSYPILEMTDAGRKVLDEKKTILLLKRKSGQHKKPLIVGDTHKETLLLFKNGLSPPEIAERRGFVLSTIYGHLADLIAKGEIKAVDCVSEEIIKIVLKAKENYVGSSLKELKEMLPFEITYEEIKIVLAGQKFETGEKRGVS